MQDILRAVDEAIRETTLAFLNNPSQFHGDGGIARFLYACLVKRDAVWRHSSNGINTLLVQSEHCTQLVYRRNCRNGTKGRFDLAIADPSSISPAGILAQRAPAIVGFEVGIQKTLDKMGDMTAGREHERPRRGDAAKLIREILLAGMKGAYLLEYYNDQRLGDARYVFDTVARTCHQLQVENLRAAFVVKREGVNQGYLSVYPASWRDQLQLDLPDLPAGWL